jgi:hypothetical protein
VGEGDFLAVMQEVADFLEVPVPSIQMEMEVEGFLGVLVLLTLMEMGAGDFQAVMREVEGFLEVPVPSIQMGVGEADFLAKLRLALQVIMERMVRVLDPSAQPEMGAVPVLSVQVEAKWQVLLVLLRNLDLRKLHSKLLTQDKVKLQEYYFLRH